MLYDIITLDPTAYVKKSKKASNFTETTEFIGVLQKKLNDWNIRCLCNNKVASAHKVKYDQFESSFLRQAHMVVYIVSLFSEVGFRDTIKKLIDSCHDKEKLNRVVVISLDKSHFVELEECVIELVHFGDYAWKSAEDKQWDILEGQLHAKLRKVENNSQMALSRQNASTLPVAIPSQKSSSKIKSFFHSLPTKFRDRPFKDQYQDSVPNITISNSHHDDFSPEFPNKAVGLRPKEDHTKLSLTSLFRKRSRKARDSGLSGTSTASNDSRNSKGQFSDMVFDLSNEPSPLCDRSAVLHTSVLEKSKSYKAKIHMFKNKASKYFNSASCLNSPENKRKKSSNESIYDDVQFSSQPNAIFSDIIVRKGVHPLNGISVINEPPLNGLVKYYSWDEDLNVKKEFILDQLTCNDLEIVATIIQPPDELESREEHTETTTYFVDEDTQPSYISELVDTKEELSSDIIDGNYFKVQYAPNDDISPKKTGKHTVTFKLDGLDELEDIMDSIEKSCNELKLSSRLSCDPDPSLGTFKSPTREKINQKKVYDPVTASRSNTHVTMSVNSRQSQEAGDSKLHSEILKSEPRTHSFLYWTADAMFRNPFIVLGVFSATAYSAPLWSTYIPRDVDIGHLLYGLIDNRIIHSLPGHVSSLVTKVASATATSLSRVILTINK